jgi:hypothetical protein
MIAAECRLFSAEPKASKFPRCSHTEEVAVLGKTEVIPKTTPEAAFWCSGGVYWIESGRTASVSDNAAM